MSARFETDDSRFPLVVVTTLDQAVTDDELRRFIDGQRAQLARREKHLVPTDARRAKVFPPKQPHVFEKWLKESAAPVSMRTRVDRPDSDCESHGERFRCLDVRLRVTRRTV